MVQLIFQFQEFASFLSQKQLNVSITALKLSVSLQKKPPSSIKMEKLLVNFTHTHVMWAKKSIRGELKDTNIFTRKCKDFNNFVWS
jgi:hypothetical protein